MPEFTTLEHENLNSVVYGALCDALMQGRFKPGNRLKKSPNWSAAVRRQASAC